MRLKTAESVAGKPTIEKGDIYSNFSNIIGFKIGICCLYDLANNDGADICSVEVCLPNADQKKFLSDIFKLLREGRLNTTSLIPLCRYSPVDKYTWICQIYGLKTFALIFTYAGDGLFMAVNQFSAGFSTCIGELDAFEEPIQQLLHFKNDVESICVNL